MVEVASRGPQRDLRPEREPGDGRRPEVHAASNVAAIAGVSRDLRGRVVLKLKARRGNVLVSRPFAHLFRQM